MKKKNILKKDFKIFYSLLFAVQLGFFIVISIVGPMFLGLWIDKTLLTRPLFFIIGMISGILIAGYVVYQLLIPLIIKNG